MRQANIAKTSGKPVFSITSAGDKIKPCGNQDPTPVTDSGNHWEMRYRDMIFRFKLKLIQYRGMNRLAHALDGVIICYLTTPPRSGSECKRP
jgi:hypothetical protein